MLIAQLSDFHMGPIGRRYEEIVDTNPLLRDAIDPRPRLDRVPVPIPFLTSP